MDSRLEHLLRNTPNVYGNSLGALLIRLFSLLIGLTLIIIGVSLVIAPFFQFSIVDIVLGNGFLDELSADVRSSIERLSKVVGIVGIVVGSILMILRHIAGYVFVRNFYIMELKEWYSDELVKREEAQKAAEEA